MALYIVPVHVYEWGSLTIYGEVGLQRHAHKWRYRTVTTARRMIPRQVQESTSGNSCDVIGHMEAYLERVDVEVVREHLCVHGELVGVCTCKYVPLL